MYVRWIYAPVGSMGSVDPVYSQANEVKHYDNYMYITVECSVRAAERVNLPCLHSAGREDG